MFPFERYVKIPKGLLHSGKNPAFSIMKQMMTHEWLQQRVEPSKDLLHRLLTPPLYNLSERRFFEFMGRGRLTTLHPPNTDSQRVRIKNNFNRIVRFMQMNDPATVIVFNEFKHTHPNYRNGTDLMSDWNPSPASVITIKTHLINQLQVDVTDDDILTLLKGPSRLVHEFQAVKINGVQFNTRSREGSDKRCTRRFIYYRNDGVKDSNGEVVHKQPGQIEHIYSVSSCNSAKLMKQYTLLHVRSLEYKSEPHDSELPFVKWASEEYETLHAPSMVNIEDVMPVNIALWPSRRDGATKDFLIVQIDPVDDEILVK
jgi:hypothetical protein